MRTRLALFVSVIVTLLFAVAVYFLVPTIFGSIEFPLPEEYKPYIIAEADKRGIDRCLVAAVIRGESNWRPNAGSRAGARGLMQIVPGTGSSFAKLYGIAYNGAGDLYDPAKNIEIGTAILHYNFLHYGSLYNALVAYNAGGSRVGNQVLPDETAGYVVKIPKYLAIYRNTYPDFCTETKLKSGNNTPATPQENFDDFSLPGATDYLDPDEFWKTLLTNDL